MAERIIISPVTRIEGHAKVSIYIDDAGAAERRPLNGRPAARCSIIIM